MTALEQGRRPADFILTEANGHRSRDNGWVLNPNSIDVGEVCEVVAATTDVVQNYKPITAPGNAVAISIYAATTSSGDDKEIAFITRDCEVNGKQLVWPNGYTAAQKRTAIAALAARGIIVRDGHEYQW